MIGLVGRFLLLLLLAARSATPADETTGETRWIGSWAAAPQPYMPGTLKTFRNQTLRLIVRASAGGRRLRIRLSNSYGDRPLLVGGAHVARRTEGPDVEPASDRTLTFGGRPAVTIATGASIASDAVPLAIPPLSDLAISLYFPEETQTTTNHLLALQQGYVSPEGDSTSLAKFVAAKTIRSWPFLTGVEVDAAASGATVVVFGDSWVDGDGSTPDANHRWPDLLAKRLADANAGLLGVLNEGIIGNRLLRDSPREPPSEFGGAMGESGLQRMDRDVLDQPGVKVVVLHFGVNDLGFPGAFTPATESVTAADLIAGFRRLIAAAHERGIRAVGSTIGPFEAATIAPGYYAPAKDAVRRELNAWIRNGREFDGVVDLDSVVRDPQREARLLPAFDRGDHLHPNDSGYAAIAGATPLTLFANP